MKLLAIICSAIVAFPHPPGIDNDKIDTTTWAKVAVEAVGVPPSFGLAPGVPNTDIKSGLVLVDISTNQFTMYEVTDGYGNKVGRWVQDRGIYSPAIVVDPGWLSMGEPLDRPRSHHFKARKPHPWLIP